MKAGISFILGLLLAFVLVFAYWIQTPHRVGAQWTKPDHSLERLSADGLPLARNR